MEFFLVGFTPSVQDFFWFITRYNIKRPILRLLRFKIYHFVFLHIFDRFCEFLMQTGTN